MWYNSDIDRTQLTWIYIDWKKLYTSDCNFIAWSITIHACSLALYNFLLNEYSSVLQPWIQHRQENMAINWKKVKSVVFMNDLNDGKIM